MNKTGCGRKLEIDEIISCALKNDCYEFELVQERNCGNLMGLEIIPTLSNKF